jgi:hypothetical protein
MFCQAGFDQWRTTIMQHLAHLSKLQATVLALWSFGMVLARSCALTAVSHLLAKGMKRQEQTVRQQLREWYYEVPRKRGTKRQALHVETCFPVLLAWVVSWWQGTQLALALDATALGTRFVVLAVSVVYRGCAIPVAWVVLPANIKHAWRREWLRRLRPALPRGWTVLVLTDRGFVCPMAVLADRPPGLASVFAHQYRRYLSARWDAVLSPLEELCPPAGDALAGPGHRLSESRAAGGVHPVGPVGGRL